MDHLSASFTTLVEHLRQPSHYPHPVSRVGLIETHISTVLLAGEFAYKLKKPYDLGFLDFTTLAARKHYCEEELRLNRRFAPGLYLGIVAITGSPEAPQLGGAGSPFEYAVKMRRFDQDALLTNVMARNALQPRHLTQFATALAGLHQSAAGATDHDPFGEPDTVHAAAIQNFTQMRPLAQQSHAARLAHLADWTESVFAAHITQFAERKRQGRVRECHGDLHLGNLILLDDQITAFDCIEFNADFRWIDVMSEVAFLVMDLTSQGRRDLSFRFLNAYLETSGDFAGLAVLDYYLVFRALVRAKVILFRATQDDTPAPLKQQAWAEFEHYLTLAESFTQHDHPCLILMHGFSGSGKSTVARDLAAYLPAIHIRSDVERKRLYGLAPLTRSQSEIDGGIYTADASQRTYARLADLAREVIDAGRSVILDATFLSGAQRKPFIDLAGNLDVPWLVVDCVADAPVLRQRVAARMAAGTDAAEADLAVLEKQLTQNDPLTGDDARHLIRVATDQPWDAKQLATQVRQFS